MTKDCAGQAASFFAIFFLRSLVGWSILPLHAFTFNKKSSRRSVERRVRRMSREVWSEAREMTPSQCTVPAARFALRHCFAQPWHSTCKAWLARKNDPERLPSTAPAMKSNLIFQRQLKRFALVTQNHLRHLSPHLWVTPKYQLAKRAQL